jgi:tetratricopeptide (TPR) repeat protein
LDSGGAVYAKVPEGGLAVLDAAVREARSIGRNASPLGVLAFDPAVHSFAVVDRWGRPDDMPHWAEDPDLELAIELAALSRMVGEVIAFYEVDEGTTMGIYAAWRDGELVRNLQWAADCWQYVEGDPQDWEAPLFAADALTRALDYADDEASIRAAFNSRRILPNSSWPRPDEISAAIRTVRMAPAFGFEPWPRRKELVKRNRELDDAALKPPPESPSQAPSSPAFEGVSANLSAQNGDPVRQLGIHARAHMAAGQNDEAMADFEKMITISPLSAEGLLGKAAVLISQKRNKEALAWLEELLPSGDLEPLRSFMTAVVADRLGDFVKAAGFFRRVMDSPNLSSDKRALSARRAKELAPPTGLDADAMKHSDLPGEVCEFSLLTISAMGNKKFAQIKKHDKILGADYLISQYPISTSEFLEIFDPDIPSPDESKHIQRTTWTEAIRYCNRLSVRLGLPSSYDEDTGMMIDRSGKRVTDISEVYGVRLPTLVEWEYAAKGWNEEKRTGAYLKILESTYIWAGDISKEKREIFSHGISEMGKLETNTIGLHGMLGNAHEWFSDLATHDGAKYKMCQWGEYYVNYDVLSYQVEKSICTDADQYGFRIVLGARAAELLNLCDENG